MCLMYSRVLAPDRNVLLVPDRDVRSGLQSLEVVRHPVETGIISERDYRGFDRDADATAVSEFNDDRFRKS